MDDAAYDQFYYPNVCHVCKRSGKLSACSSCRAYRYCSKEHQRVHWRRHAEVCRALNKYALEAGLRGCFETRPGRDWTATRLAAKGALERELRRPLTVSESQMWMFPRACAACRTIDGDGASLYDCGRCPAASFCCRAHELAADHRRACDLLRIQRDCYRALLRVSEETADVRAILRGEKRGHALTLVEAMIAADVPRNRDRLIVHVVGAVAERANFDRDACSALFRWSSSLRSVKIVLVGPELERGVGEGSDAPPGGADGDVDHGLEPVPYSEYVSSESFESPDAVAVFNCGFDEFSNSPRDTWKRSLPLLLRPRVPLLMTSYTEDEAIRDFRRLKSVCDVDEKRDVLIYCRRNKFRGLLPLRDWTNDNEFYYVNNFISVLKKA